MSDMSIILRTSEMRGDHSADVGVAIKPVPGETLEQLMARCKLSPCDTLEIRATQERVTWHR